MFPCIFERNCLRGVQQLLKLVNGFDYFFINVCCISQLALEGCPYGGVHKDYSTYWRQEKKEGSFFYHCPLVTFS